MDKGRYSIAKSATDKLILCSNNNSKIHLYCVHYGHEDDLLYGGFVGAIW